MENLEKYTNETATKLVTMFPEKLRKYVGIDKNSIKEMIEDLNDDFLLIKKTISDLWEQNINIEDAIEELWYPLNIYFNASASVM